VPLEVADRVRRIDGVTAVVPRVVGGLTLGKDREPAVLVGLPHEHLPKSVACVAGRLPADGPMPELVVGTELARRLRLEVGSVIPPFYRSRRGERPGRVVGLFAPAASLWQSRLVFTTFDWAAAVFDQEGLATDLLVWCRPGYEGQVRAAVNRTIAWDAGPGRVRPLVTARTDLEAELPGGLRHREGIFNLHFVLAFAVGIAVLLVTTGFGLAGRRREVGILKATGWQTDEVLLRAAVEGVALAVAAASASILLAYAWLRGLNGWGVAAVFLTGVDRAPSFPVPFRLAPVPVLLAYLLALVLVLCGGLYSTWRAATAPPRDAMR
jgi:ABC-type lipoprotein release transport system permease subunit